jgi:hypothetical protein
MTARGHLRALAGVGIVLAGLALAACGGGSSSGPSAKHDCGAIHQGAGGVRGEAATVTCFWRAYSQCQPATLQYTFMGVDAGVTHTFTTQPEAFGGCALTDVAQSYVVPNHQVTHTYTCASLKQQQGGLLFVGCGAEGDVFVPPPTGQ